MKKYLEILGLGLILSCSAMADTTIPWTKEGCESVKGTWITAHSTTDSGCDANHCNGMNFCSSPQIVNWWSALIWCKSIGHRLADAETACPNGLSSARTCANLKGLRGSFWLNLPTDASHSAILTVGDANGDIQTIANWTLRTNLERRSFCAE